MKRWMKVLFAFVFSFLFSFTCVGYANLTDTLTIHGSLEVAPQEGVYISDAKVTSGTGTVNHYLQTVMSSSVNLSGTGSVTIRVTVYNNSGIVQGYNALKYYEGEETYDNPAILADVGLDRRQPVNPGERLSFDVTFTYVNAANATSTVLNSVLNFEFLPLSEIPEDEGEIAVNDVLGRFKEILNTPAEHVQLTDQMDKYSSADRYDESYIGNVIGAHEDDTALLQSLFAGNLSLIINGVDTEVKVMIKREDLDGDGNNEMTIYMTTDDLERDSLWSAGTAPVYVAVFTPFGDSWVQLGSMYEGTATVKAYDGNIFGEGSFDTDTWRTTNANGQTANRTIEQVIAALD